MPTLKNELRMVSRLSFIFALDMMTVYDEMDDVISHTYPAKQLVKNGTQIGAKIARCRAMDGFDFLRSFGMAHRRAESAVFWLDAVYKLGYIKQAVYVENKIRLDALKNAMDGILKSTRLQKAISKIGKVEIVDEKRLNYN